jgi:predicted negative regulator of RcsB-dependent stress response
MAHISRRELKTDEFHDTLENFWESLAEHKQTIWQVSVVVVVVAAAIFGWRYYTGHKDAEASAAFTQAMQVYSTPVQQAGQPPVPGQTSYPDNQAKYQAAQKAMAGVAAHFGGTRYGQMAAYYEAVSLDRLKQYQRAADKLLPLTKSGDAEFQALAKFELAHVYDRMSKPALALPLLRELLAKPSVFVPKPVVLLALGDHYMGQNDNQQAAKYYKQIQSEYPNTGLADQASRRLEMLGTS